MLLPHDFHPESLIAVMIPCPFKRFACNSSRTTSVPSSRQRPVIPISLLEGERFGTSSLLASVYAVNAPKIAEYAYCFVPTFTCGQRSAACLLVYPFLFFQSFQSVYLVASAVSISRMHSQVNTPLISSHFAARAIPTFGFCVHPGAKSRPGVMLNFG